MYAYIFTWIGSARSQCQLQVLCHGVGNSQSEHLHVSTVVVVCSQSWEAWMLSVASNNKSHVFGLPGNFNKSSTCTLLYAYGIATVILYRPFGVS